jgi:hypothetical protein
MMEYASAAMQQGTISTQPELGRLKAAAERIGMVAARIDGFAYRFHGPTPTPENAKPGADAPQPPQSYRNDLETLFAQIERLEITSCYLDTIG